MSKQQRYTQEFKNEAVKQVTEQQHPVAEVADRLGASGHSLYAWIKRYNTPEAELQQGASQQAKIRRLKAELHRVTDERDILKKAAAYFAKLSG
jgi:transposase